MKTLQSITVLVILLVQTIGFSQEKTTQKNDTILKTEKKIDTKKLEKLVGKYLLQEANFILEIKHEKEKFYVVSPYSKDLLQVKSEISLHEPTRGVYFSVVEKDENAVRFNQNGYESILKRVKSKE